MKNNFIEKLKTHNVQYQIKNDNTIIVKDYEYEFCDEYITKKFICTFYFNNDVEQISYETFDIIINNCDDCFLLFKDIVHNKIDLKDCVLHYKHNYLDMNTNIYIQYKHKFIYTLNVLYSDDEFELKKSKAIISYSNLQDKDILEELHKRIELKYLLDDTKEKLKTQSEYIDSIYFKRIREISKFEYINNDKF